jgi:hypothetical protein
VLLAGLSLGLPDPAAAQATLSLPVPEKDSLPRERISLSIKLPEKVEKVQDPPVVRPKLRSPVFDSYVFGATRPIPRRDFVFDTLKRLERIGVVPDLASRQMVRSNIRDFNVLGRSIWSYYEKLLDIYRKDALPRFDIEPLDIERFRQVMDIFVPLFQTEYRNALEADRLLVKMIDQLKQVRGQGTIKLVELKEATDGSMVLELEVRKEGLKGWP